MDEITRKLYEKYNINPEEREKENIEIINKRDKELKSHYKNLLQKQLEKGINEKFENLILYLRDPRFYYFVELESNIWQVIKCLLCESYSASITLTNHILERTLKLALIQNEAGLQPKSIENWNETYKNSHKYSSWVMHDTITECKNQKLITSKQVEDLKNYKNSIRNGFSHFDAEKILVDENNIINGKQIKSENSKSEIIPLNLKQIPILQNNYITKFAEENAEIYFDFVFNIIIHIERKFKEKYYLEYQENLKSEKIASS